MTPSARNTLLLAALLGLITFALFSPALRHQYIDIDDVQYTVETPQVVGGLSLANVRWAFTTVHESWYSPLLWISFMADSSLFGPVPFGYHFTNVLLHAANALLLFGIFVRLTRAPLAAFFAAALWALHPLRIESVAWIAERKDVLSGLFFLLAIGAHLRWAEHPTRARHWAVFWCMLGGMLSKTILVVLPPLLLLLDAWPLRRLPIPSSVRDLHRWRPLLLEKLPLFVLMLAGILLTLITHRHAHDVAPPLPAVARLALIAPTYLAHLAQVLWPAHLALFYPISYPTAAQSLAALFAVALGLWAAWRLRNALPGLLLGGLWFGIALLPLIRGIRFDEQSAYPDRYTYLPAIGLSLAFAGLFIAVSSQSRRHFWMASLLSVSLLAACAVRSALYIPLWKSPEVLGPILIRLVPDNPLVNNMYGKLLAAQLKPDEAIPHFRKAERWNVVASCNLVSALLHAGQPEEALSIATEICANPKAPPDAFLALGICHLQLDQAARAIPPLQRAAQLMPGYPLVWQMLYRAHLESGDRPAAEACIQQLRRLNAPGVADFDGLVGLYTRTWMEGNSRLAWPFFANNFARHPDHVLLHNNAAWLLATTEHPPAPPAEAVRLAQTALALGGDDHPEFLDTLAAAHAANGNFAAAIQTARRALELANSQTPETRTLQVRIQHRLELYQREIPYREPASPASSR